MLNFKLNVLAMTGQPACNQLDTNEATVNNNH